jgi:hypothetical protein
MQSRPLPGTQDSQGAQEESKLDAEMAEMRTRLAVIQREVHLLTAPAAKLRACLEANGAFVAQTLHCCCPPHTTWRRVRVTRVFAVQMLVTQTAFPSVQRPRA